MNKRVIKNILQESEPYDFLLLMVSAIVGFVLSLFGDTNITCICATIIVVLFILFWFIYNVSENKADYMRMINREFKNGHWYDVFYMAFPICSTLRRMGKYSQSVEVARKMEDVLNKINVQKIDADWAGRKYTNIEKIKERLMINDLGYSYFMLKDIESAKKYVHMGIKIAKKQGIEYAELKGWTILLQMLLIDNDNSYFTSIEVKEIYDNYKIQFDKYWKELNGEFPSQDLADYISYLKALEIEAMYKYRRSKEINKQEFLDIMQKLADGYKEMRLNDKYYDCMKCVYEVQLSESAFDPHGDAETSIVGIIDGAFDPNIGLTPVQYIKYVTIYLDYYIREKSATDKQKDRKQIAKTNKERISKYIRRVEKELWYVEDPCIDRFKAVKVKYLKAVK